MQLPIFKTEYVNDVGQFVEFWSKIYSYSLEKLYTENISKKVSKKNDIQNLFIWKNGMKLSTSKQKSFDVKIIKKLDLICHLKKVEKIDLDMFKNDFGNLSAVWKIFLLHIIKPSQYPIYDQHVHRAYSFIHKVDYLNISADSINNREKEEFYFKVYLSFVEKISNVDLKKMDEAFFSFGQFINTRKNSALIN